MFLLFFSSIALFDLHMDSLKLITQLIIPVSNGVFIIIKLGLTIASETKCYKVYRENEYGRY
jgi:hypothetical protein